MKYSREISSKRRKNAKLYPIYKMFSWDLLFFYSIEFLFCTITKKIDVSELLVINGLYLLFKIMMQIPAVTITDFLGKKISIILGNFILILYILILIFIPGSLGVIIANLVCSLGFSIKNIAEPNLLYDSVSTKGGDGIYSKLEAKGGSLYYILDGVASLVAGYLFVVNNYLPILVCLGFLIISTILSFGFSDIYKIEEVNKIKEGSKTLKNTIKEYRKDLVETFKFILKSNRMKAFVLFQIVFYSLIEIIDTYNGDLLVNIGIKEEQFSMIFAILTFIGGISISLKGQIEKKFKNRTLAFISLIYIIACIIIGTVSSIFTGSIIIPIILIMYAVQRMSTSIWYILEEKYLKNFTNESMRNKLTFTYEFIGGIAAGIFSMLGGLLLKVLNIQNAFLIIGLLSLAIMVLTLDYMRTRFGLKGEEYSKEELEF